MLFVICVLSIKFDLCLALSMPYENVPRWIREIPDRFKTQEMCDEIVGIEPRSFAFVPDHFRTEEMWNDTVIRDAFTLGYVSDNVKTQGMYNEAMHENPAAFFLVPDHFKTQEMCIKALEVDPWELCDVPDYLKTKKIHDDVMRRNSYSLRFILNWFVTQQQLKTWYDEGEYYNDDELIEWYDGYQKRKRQKALIKKELMSIAWHLSRWWDWCVPEDEKQEVKKMCK